MANMRRESVKGLLFVFLLVLAQAHELQHVTSVLAALKHHHQLQQHDQQLKQKRQPFEISEESKQKLIQLGKRVVELVISRKNNNNENKQQGVSFLEITDNETDRKQQLRVNLIAPLVLIFVGTFLMFRKDELTQKPTISSHALLHVFGFYHKHDEPKPINPADPTESIRKVGAAVRDFVLSFGVGVVLFVVGMVLTAKFINDAWGSSAYTRYPLRANAFLADLQMDEWSWRTPSTTSLTAADCNALNRESSDIEACSFPGNNVTECGFCKLGFETASRIHGPGLTPCNLVIAPVALDVALSFPASVASSQTTMTSSGVTVVVSGFTSYTASTFACNIDCTVTVRIQQLNPLYSWYRITTTHAGPTPATFRAEVIGDPSSRRYLTQTVAGSSYAMPVVPNADGEVLLSFSFLLGKQALTTNSFGLTGVQVTLIPPVVVDFDTTLSFGQLVSPTAQWSAAVAPAPPSLPNLRVMLLGFNRTVTDDLSSGNPIPMPDPFYRGYVACVSACVLSVSVLGLTPAQVYDVTTYHHDATSRQANPVPFTLQWQGASLGSAINLTQRVTNDMRVATPQTVTVTVTADAAGTANATVTFNPVGSTGHLALNGISIRHSSSSAAPPASVCGLLFRSSLASSGLLDSVVMCGDCVAGYSGSRGPSLTRCTPCEVCTGNTNLIGCGYSEPLGLGPHGRGACVASCPQGYCLTDTRCIARSPLQDASCHSLATKVASCVGQRDLDPTCSAVESCSCTEMPSFAIFGNIPEVRLGLWPIELSLMLRGVSKWSNRFNIKPAYGGRTFQPNVFDYEWRVNSSVNPDAYPYLSYPWGKVVPIQIRGVVADANIKSISIEVPLFQSLNYPTENTWKIDNNKVMRDTVEYVSGSLYQAVGSDGRWRITTIYPLPEDPSKGLCPLPIRITVTAQDNMSQRVYYIHAIGSNKESCAHKPLPDVVFSLPK
eukprot:c8865_g1_i1.p1 GENE.c8865_g1_i1~~c8865_g1_i1.p1  ORF type:complete len:962 (+),score=263.36 c8865_g1_i1:42-2888(+)